MSRRCGWCSEVDPMVFCKSGWSFAEFGMIGGASPRIPLRFIRATFHAPLSLVHGMHPTIFHFRFRNEITWVGAEPTWMVPLGLVCGDLPEQLQPSCVDLPCRDGLAQCAARFVRVVAVAEAALAEILRELDKSLFYPAEAQVMQAERLHAGAVDQ